MDTKILFSDLDGTLLTSDKEVGRVDFDAISRMTAAGHKFVIATGRPLASAIKIAEHYGWTGEGYYISSFNGGLIYDCAAGKAIVRHELPMEYVRFLMDEARSAGLHCHTYSDDMVVAERETEELKFYSDAVRLPYIIVDDVTKYLKRNPVKVIVSSHRSHEALDPFRAGHAEWAKGKLTHYFSHPILLEYLNPESTKGRAVEYMCDYFNIPISDSIAVGDEENDLSMIETAGIGVCMKNGTAGMKAAADYVTENDNDHSGICEVIEKFILNQYGRTE